jgi:PAS domain S-box-containing protein
VPTSNVDQPNGPRADVSLAMLLDGSADGLCALDAAGRILYLNPAAERILGGTRRELTGRFALDVLGAQAPLLRRAIEDSSAPVDFRLRAPSAAEERWFDVRACPSGGPNAGAGGGIMLHFRHAATTSRGELDGTLNDASADVLAAIGEAAPDFVWVTDAAGDLLYVNRRWIEYTGLTSAQTDRRGYMRTIHPADLPRFLNKVEYAQQQGAEIEGEFRYRRHDGAYRWFWVRSTPVKDEAGRVLRRVGVAVDVTDRIDAVRALRDSEARYRSIFDSAAIGMNETTADGVFTAVNQRFCDMLGYSRDELLGMTPFHLTHPADAERSAALRQSLAAGERESYAWEKRYLRKDGGEVWANTWVSAVRDEAGRVVRLIGAVQDVTAQKRLEDERARSEALTQHIVEHSPIGILVADTAGRFMHVNNAWLNMLGYTIDDVQGGTVTWKEMTIPEHRHLDERAIQEVRSKGSHAPFEKTLIRKDGSRIPCLAATAYLGGPGEVGVGFLVDLSEVKAADEALRHSEDKYRTLTDAVGSLMWMSDAGGQVTFVNRRWSDYLNGDAREILGSGWRDCIHPDDLPEVLRERTAAVEEGRAYTIECRLKRHDGQYRWHLTRIVPQKDDAGRVLNWFGTAADIHDLKTAEAAVLHAKAEAEHANKAKDQFLAVLSHELRTPLTPVVMTVAAMEMDRTISPQMREDLAMIRRNIELETKLIDDLLDVTRISNGKLRLQPRPTDVHTLMRNVLEMLKSDVAEKRLEAIVELKAADPSVFGDPARLQQVFWNLIKNAVKFTPDGGRMTVRTWNASERAVCVEVADSGAGIEPSVLPRIFSAFDQGEQTITRQFGGLGLGLAISRALTELHGGTIRAASEGKGHGSQFTLELPTRMPVERMVDQIQPIGPCGEGRPRPRILLVEDHLDTQRTLVRLLEHRGYDVLTAASVAAATAALHGAAPRVDLIISDIGLPDATGYDLMRQLRAGGSNLPGIAVSGFGMDGDLKSSQDAGFAAHLTKPVDVQHLDATIRSLLPHPAHAVPTTA